MVFLGKDGSLYFRCTIKGCIGRIKTDDVYANVEIRNANHHHPSCPEAVTVRQTKNKMRVKAKESTDSIPSIYRECTAALATDP